MSTHNLCFYGELTEISLNDHQILSLSVVLLDETARLGQFLLILCLPVSSAGNLGKQFGPRSGPTNCWA